jgi:hypothetical protein
MIAVNYDLDAVGRTLPVGDDDAGLYAAHPK